METVYKPKKLNRSGALFSVFFLMLMMVAFVTSAQTTSTLYTAIDCFGRVFIKMPTSTDPAAVIQGPCVRSTNPQSAAANQVWLFKVLPDPGFEFLGWSATNTPTSLYQPQPFTATLTTDLGYNYTHTMTGPAPQANDVHATFSIINPGVTMSANFTVTTIPGTQLTGTGCSPVGTPLILNITGAYAGTSTQTYPNIYADALLSTDRVSGFNGLRIINMVPAPSGIVFPIVLTGNNLFLSDLFNAATPGGFTPATLVSQIGTPINWVVTIDGMTPAPTDQDFNVNIASVAYRLPMGEPACVTSFADTDIHVISNLLDQTPPPAQLITCGSPFCFNIGIDYPLITNIDHPAGTIKTNAKITSDQIIPAGTSIAWIYTATGVLTPVTGTYPVPAAIPAGTPLYLSTIIGAPAAALLGHSNLDVDWNFCIANLPSGKYNLDIQPIVQLAPGGTCTLTYDYPIGTLMEIELINNKVINTLLFGPETVSTAVGTPVILPLASTVSVPTLPPHTGIMIDGMISRPGGSFPAGTVLVGARANSVSVTITDGNLGGLNNKTFSQIFASGYPAQVVTNTTNWEFDFYADSYVGSLPVKVEMFTYFSATPSSASCTLAASDVVTITYAAASCTVSPTTATACLYNPIPFTATIVHPAIIQNEPATVGDITEEIKFTCTKAIPANTTITWSGPGTPSSGSYLVPSTIPAGTVLTLSTIRGAAPLTFVNRNGLTDVWNFTMLIPGLDAAGLANAGTYTLTIQPVVKLSPYTDYNFITAQTASFNIPIYNLIMAVNPVFAGTTVPAVPGPYQYGCGAKVTVSATPSVSQGWTFQNWTVDPNHDAPTAYLPFDNANLATTIFNMPSHNATVTANFDQNEYTLNIGVIGQGQKVIVWVDGATSAFELTGNRECAPIEPTSGTYLTFTHGETIILEVIPTDCYAWHQWYLCDGISNVNDPDFTYLGINGAGHPEYQLVFRSNKELKAWFKKKLTITATVPEKTYDCNATATFNSHSQYSFNSYLPATCSPTYVIQGNDVKLVEWPTATFSSKDVEWNVYPSNVKSKTVTITGLALTGAHAQYYVLVDANGSPTTTTTTQAKIQPVTVTVGGSPVAANKLYDCVTPSTTTISGATVSGLLSCDNGKVTLGGHTSGTFSNKNVAWVSAYMGCVADKSVAWNPYLTATATGTTTDWQNYILTPPAALAAKITPRPLVRTGVVANSKEYDGTVTATIGNWGSWQTDITGKGIVCSDPVNLNTSAAVATFETMWVAATKTVTITGLFLDGGTSTSTLYQNYVLENYTVSSYCYAHVNVYGTGTILPPPYAKFTPAYKLNCSTPDEIDNVTVEYPFNITFSRAILDFQGLTLPTVDLGEFVKIDKWIGTSPPAYGDHTLGGDWVPVGLYSTRSGNAFTVVPGIPGAPGTPVDLEWSTYYRLRYDDIWANSTISPNPLVPVHYRLDKNSDGTYTEPPTVPCSLVDDKQVIFKTISSVLSPIVTPSGCNTITTVNYNDEIKITFVNPVKYRNGNLISSTPGGGNPTHKFQLQAKPKGTWSNTTWVNVLFEAQAMDFEQELGGPDFGPKTIKLIPLAQTLNGIYYPASEMLLCYEYQVLWRNVNDIGPGFLDMNTNTVVGGPEKLWEWCTTCNFPIALSYTANSALTFPPAPNTNRNNLLLISGTTTPTLVNVYTDGISYSPNGKIKDPFTVTKPDLYTFMANIGEGFHINKWTRKTGASEFNVYSNGSAFVYASSAPTGYTAFTGTNIPWNADAAVSFQKYQWNILYDLNTYKVNAYAFPTPAIGKVSISGGSYAASTTVTFDHGSLVTIAAKPDLGTACAPQAKGYYHKGWAGYSWLKNPVARFTTYDPFATAKPEFLAPPTGTLTGTLTGADLTHNTTYNVEAKFDVFNPRIDVTIDPAAPPSVGHVDFTTQFVLGEDWGIIYTNTNYAVFKYNTPVTLTPVSESCGWEFEKWQRWNGTYDAQQHRVYVDFNPTFPICVVECYDIIAKFRRVTFPVSATTNATTMGSVLLEGVNASGVTVQKLSNVTNPVVSDNFLFETVVTLTVFPIPGYEVKSWNNPNVIQIQVGQWIDRTVWQYSVGAGNCAQPMNLVANMGLRQYKIKGMPNAAYNLSKLGTVTGSPATTTSTVVQLNKFTNYPLTGVTTGTFEHFVTGHTLTAIPIDARFRFDYWDDAMYGDIGSTSPLSLPAVSETRTITAVFVPDLPVYACTVSNNPLAGGSTVPEADTYYFFEHNKIVGIPSVHTFTAYPAVGYEFVNWAYPAWPALATPTFSGTNSQTITFNMPGNAVNLVANYRLKEHTLTTNVRTYLRGPSQSTCPNVVNYGGIITPATSTTTTYHAGQQITFTATAVPGFEFVNFMVGTLSGDYFCILTGRQINTNGLSTFTYTVPLQNEPLVVYGIFREQTFPAFPKYTLTTSSNPTGSAITVGDGTYVQTINVLVDQTDANLNDGYGFVNWSVTGFTTSPTTSPIVVPMDGHKTAVANYGLIGYELTAYAKDGLGFVTANNQFGTNPVVEPFVITDDPIYCTATPMTHYVFDRWTYDYDGTIPVLDVLGNPVTQNFYWIPVAHDEEIFAQFVYEQYTVTLDTRIDNCTGVVGGGTAAIIAGPPAPYVLGDVITILATEAIGYQFKHWTDELCQIVITQPQYNWTVTGSVTFVAVFEAIRYNVNGIVNITAGGTVTPTLQVRTIGQTVSITGYPATGYEFDAPKWTKVSGPTLPTAVLNANPLTYVIENSTIGDATYRANFKKIDWTVTGTSGDLTKGTVAPASQIKNYQDNVNNVTATPSVVNGYYWLSWTATGLTTAPTTNPAVFTMPNNAVGLVANWGTYTYTVSASASPTGSGTFSALNSSYPYNSQVNVTATANAGWIFDSWTIPAGVTPIGGTTSRTTNLTFNMPTSSVALVAKFIISNNKLVGQVKYFNMYETVMPAAANIKVSLGDGSQEQFLQYPSGGIKGYYEFTNLVPGTNYTIKVWEAPTSGGTTLANTWGWNHWGGVNSLDALIISYMYNEEPVLATQFPWLTNGAAVPNWTELFGGFNGHNYNVANVIQDAQINNVDALNAMYRGMAGPGSPPFLGGAFNFQLGGSPVATLGAMVHPWAPANYFTQTGTYLGTSSMSPNPSVYYTKSFTGAPGTQVYNIYYVASGDVDASGNPTVMKTAANTLEYKDVLKVNVGDEVSIPVRIDDNLTIGAMNVELTYNTNLLKVNGIEGFEAFNINETNGTINAAMYDVNGRDLSKNGNVIIVKATILAPIDATTRFFELGVNTMFGDIKGTPVDGLTLKTNALTTDNLTSVGDKSSADLSHKCFPNPFNSVTTIQYTLPEMANVELKIYNNLGSMVKSLVSENQTAGVHNVKLNSTDLNGAGVYFYRIIVKGDAETYTGTGSLILVK